MSLSKTVYDALKAVLTTESRLAGLSEQVGQHVESRPQFDRPRTWRQFRQVAKETVQVHSLFDFLREEVAVIRQATAGTMKIR